MGDLETNRGAPEPAPEPEPAIRLRRLSGEVVLLPWALWRNQNVDQLMQYMHEGLIDGVPGRRRRTYPETQYVLWLGTTQLEGRPYTLEDAGVVPGAELLALPVLLDSTSGNVVVRRANAGRVWVHRESAGEHHHPRSS